MEEVSKAAKPVIEVTDQPPVQSGEDPLLPHIKELIWQMEEDYQYGVTALNYLQNNDYEEQFMVEEYLEKLISINKQLSSLKTEAEARLLTESEQNKFRELKREWRAEARRVAGEIEGLEI